MREQYRSSKNRGNFTGMLEVVNVVNKVTKESLPRKADEYLAATTREERKRIYGELDTDIKRWLATALVSICLDFRADGGLLTRTFNRTRRSEIKQAINHTTLDSAKVTLGLLNVLLGDETANLIRKRLTLDANPRDCY